MLLLAAIAIWLAGPTESARDPWTWPFSRDSIWNLPIGSKAVYTPAGLTRSQFAGIDHERFFKLKASDPERRVYAPSSWGQRWPGDRSHPLGTMPVPDDLLIPDAQPPSTPNECCAFLAADGTTVFQLEPACRVQKAGPIVGYPREPQNLFGPGTFGTHWGSGLSTLGGSIRLGELTGRDPIHHAIKINVWGNRLYYGPDVKGFRWPADRCDNEAQHSYHGHNPKLAMGTLLALDPHLNPNDLGIKTAVGKKFFAALQDYGAYVTDDAGWDDYDLCAEVGVEDEVSAQTGLKMSASTGPYFDDLMRLITQLSIVDNNAPGSVGGGGRRRRPLAPPFKH